MARSFVRGVIARAMSSGSRVPLGSSATSRTTMPRSRRVSHGPRLASWSSWVMTTSSPGCQARTRARERAKQRVVMLAPKEISRQEGAPRKAATVSRVSWMSWSVSLDVLNCPWVLALHVR